MLALIIKFYSSICLCSQFYSDEDCNLTTDSSARLSRSGHGQPEGMRPNIFSTDIGRSSEMRCNNSLSDYGRPGGMRHDIFLTDISRSLASSFRNDDPLSGHGQPSERRPNIFSTNDIGRSSEMRLNDPLSGYGQPEGMRPNVLLSDISRSLASRFRNDDSLSGYDQPSEMRYTYSSTCFSQPLSLEEFRRLKVDGRCDNSYQPLVDRGRRHLAFENFYEATIRSCNDNLKENRETRYILNLIYCSLGWDPTKLALIVSTSLHNTSYYTVFENRSSSDRFRSRGLLMIQTKDNYEKLSRLSSKNIDYVRDPSRLSNIDQSEIEDTIAFWKDLMINTDYTFDSMLDKLRVKNWVERGYDDQGINNWNHLYEELRRNYTN
ncbi:hypothetical protein P3W45_000418 [Vairimorpha bombi]|jgi:hypothetical protein